MPPFSKRVDWCEVMKYKLLLLFWALSCNHLFAELENHLKPATNKSISHQIKNIDFIYLINLDQRPEKLKSCLDQLSPYGIIPYRFSAVNGWELSLEVINDLGVKYEHWMTKGQKGTYYPLDGGGEPKDEMIQVLGRTYFLQTTAPGSIGVILSHLSILQDALDSGYETIWVMEDDIEVIRDPHLLSDLIERLDRLVGKDRWDILFTDTDTKGQDGKYVPCVSHALRPNFSPKNPDGFAQKRSVSPDFMQIGARYGAYSMIVRRSGMKKLLNFFKHYHLFLPFDMDYTLPTGIQLYALKDDVISTQPQALTDNGKCNYKKKLQIP
jgi:GR25 family glycosyltransferase involved in LPS biosynthesis